MSDVTTRCLDTFPLWLRSLGEDAAALAGLLGADSLPESARRYVAGGLNYVFKSLDLIPDGIEDLGFLDDAFILRVAAAVALADAPNAKDVDPRGNLARLAEDAKLIAELLGADNARLEKYVRDLTKGAARGRTVEEIVTDPAIRSAFVSEVRGWAKGYNAPSFSRDEKNIVKLKSFLGTKLPK